MAAGHRRRRRAASLTAASTTAPCRGRDATQGSWRASSVRSTPGDRRGSLRSEERSSLHNLVFGGSRTVRNPKTMMQSCASAARLLGGGSILQERHNGQGGHRLTATSDRLGAQPARPMAPNFADLNLAPLVPSRLRDHGGLPHRRRFGTSGRACSTTPCGSSPVVT